MPASKTNDLLCRYLRELMDATESTQGEICLKVGEVTRGVQVIDEDACAAAPEILIGDCLHCSMFLKNNRLEPLVIDALNDNAACTRMRRKTESCLLFPLRYQCHQVGLIALAAGRPDHYKTAHVDLSRLIGSELTYQLKRNEFGEAIEATLGKDAMLIGRSYALRQVDKFIEKASSAGLPVLITGEFGSERKQVAYAMHACGRRDYPFVEVKCARLDSIILEQSLCAQLKRSDGATIFFDGIDEMEYELQCLLADVLERETVVSTSSRSRPEPIRARLVASALRPVEGERRGPLLEKFDYLIVEVAPLRERREDIEPLVEYYLDKYSDRPDRSFSAEASHALEAYDWPKNVYELERVVARLAILSDDSVIGLRDVCKHVPGLANGSDETPSPPTLPGQHPRPPVIRSKRPGVISQVNMRVMQLADELIKGESTEADKLHPGLQTALKYIAENLHEAISLPELARHAGVSTSHLAYLFKKSLGVNFKLFLAILRIEEAKQLLVAKPHMPVTEISFQVGFGDLRHFERTFKRLVGRPPREYRHAALGAA